MTNRASTSGHEDTVDEGSWNAEALPSGVTRAWRDASSLLSEAGLPSTFETVCALVAAGRGYPARHARGLILAAIEQGAR